MNILPYFQMKSFVNVILYVLNFRIVFYS